MKIYKIIKKMMKLNSNKSFKKNYQKNQMNKNKLFNKQMSQLKI